MGRHPNLDDRGHRQYGADRSSRTWNKSADLTNISALAWPGEGFLRFPHLVLCVYSREFSPLAPMHSSLQSVILTKRPVSSGVHQIKKHLMAMVILEQPPPPPLKPRLWQFYLQLNQNGPDLLLPHTILKGVQVISELKMLQSVSIVQYQLSAYLSGPGLWNCA